MKAIPNLHIERNPNPQAPLLLAVQTFPEMGLSGLGKHFTDLYSESPETKEQEQESFSKRRQKRIIGDQMQKVYRDGIRLWRCLRPNIAFEETIQEERKRRGLYIYLHLMKMMFVVHNVFCMQVGLDKFGAKFLGDLYILVIYFFSLTVQ